MNLSSVVKWYENMEGGVALHCFFSFGTIYVLIPDLFVCDDFQI